MNKILSILLLSLPAGKLCAQIPDSVKTKPAREFNDVTGLTAYYFLQEDSTGVISEQTIRQPYLQNRIVLEDTTRPLRNTVSFDELYKAIHAQTHDPKWDPDNHYRFYRFFHRKDRLIHRSLGQHISVMPGSVVFRKTPNGWESRQEHSVLYFTVDAQQQKRFSHSSDSLIVPSLRVAFPAGGFYSVVTFRQANGRDSSRVYAYNGTDLTDSIARHVVSKPVRMLLLVNGYRGPSKDNDPGDGLITKKDRYYYWYKIDNRFEEALRPDVMLFMDGSFPIATSNHRTKLRFGMSWLRTKLTRKNQGGERFYRRLNTRINPEGFNYRVEQGRLAGKAFLLARCLSPGSDTVRDTIDIVCHSMGYACTLGFLEIVKEHMVLGNMYIMAPENAGIEGFDWNRFQQVWQYGSNCETAGGEPLRIQDGIAPQCAVKGIDQLPQNQGGRVYFPPEWPGRNFVDSHMVYSYDWMFDCIPEGEPGYIQR